MRRAAAVHHPSTETEKHGGRNEQFPRLCVDGVCFDNIDRGTALEAVRRFVADGDDVTTRVVNFVNVHSVTVANARPDMMTALRNSDLVLPDGSGLALACRVAGLPIRENLNGTDFVPQVIAEAERIGCSVYLLGARKEIIDACVQRVRNLFPRLTIAGWRHGHFAEEELPEILEGIRAAQADLLLVGMGSPFQELWIDRYGRDLGARVSCGVGGLFDFLSGLTPRAPAWMRKSGLEWVYRFAHNPAAKWERVLVEIPAFAIRTLSGRVSVKVIVHEGARNP
jgi:N-acetylglucosaminyldiphosphoundecaprenol N-acetyl-beta-D-mannosaminyltransferase